MTPRECLPNIAGTCPNQYQCRYNREKGKYYCCAPLDGGKWHCDRKLSNRFPRRSDLPQRPRRLLRHGDLVAGVMQHHHHCEHVHTERLLMPVGCAQFIHWLLLHERLFVLTFNTNIYANIFLQRSAPTMLNSTRTLLATRLSAPLVASPSAAMAIRVRQRFLVAQPATAAWEMAEQRMVIRRMQMICHYNTVLLQPVARPVSSCTRTHKATFPPAIPTATRPAVSPAIRVSSVRRGSNISAVATRRSLSSRTCNRSAVQAHSRLLSSQELPIRRACARRSLHKSVRLATTVSTLPPARSSAAACEEVRAHRLQVYKYSPIAVCPSGRLAFVGTTGAPQQCVPQAVGACGTNFECVTGTDGSNVCCTRTGLAGTGGGGSSTQPTNRKSASMLMTKQRIITVPPIPAGSSGCQVTTQCQGGSACINGVCQCPPNTQPNAAGVCQAGVTQQPASKIPTKTSLFPFLQTLPLVSLAHPVVRSALAVASARPMSASARAASATSMDNASNRRRSMASAQVRFASVIIEKTRSANCSESAPGHRQRHSALVHWQHIRLWQQPL